MWPNKWTFQSVHRIRAIGSSFSLCMFGFTFSILFFLSIEDSKPLFSTKSITNIEAAASMMYCEPCVKVLLHLWSLHAYLHAQKDGEIWNLSKVSRELWIKRRLFCQHIPDFHRFKHTETNFDQIWYVSQGNQFIIAADQVNYSYMQ